MSPALPAYEVYALKYAGPFTSKLAMLLSGKSWDEDIKRNYYIWAVKGDNEIVVVDTGCSTALAQRRELAGFEDPINMLSRIGADRHNVRRIVITHMHFDHAGGTGAFSSAFPDAIFYVQKKEFDFWVKDKLATRHPFVDAADADSSATLALLATEGRVEFVSGDEEILPGIELLLTPGHTRGLQAVAINTAVGKAVLASDTIHIRRNLIEEIPSSMITDGAGWIESCDRLRTLALPELIFSGHDIEMLTKYPQTAKNVTRLT
jgi:glyoxylase-like metal-dependent hydrolase (beta-lactamase superfamily II)